MAKKDEKSGAKKSPAPMKSPAPAVVRTPPAAPKKVEKPELKVSFARWFRTKKHKPHWAAGMQAYTDTRRRRTLAEWDRLFKNY